MLKRIEIQIQFVGTQLYAILSDVTDKEHPMQRALKSEHLQGDFMDVARASNFSRNLGEMILDRLEENLSMSFVEGSSVIDEDKSRHRESLWREKFKALIPVKPLEQFAEESNG